MACAAGEMDDAGTFVNSLPKQSATHSDRVAAAIRWHPSVRSFRPGVTGTSVTSRRGES